MTIQFEPLQEIKTAEGLMFPIFRDWDPWHDCHAPKMVYVTTMAPNTAKKIIAHKKRVSFVAAISGDVCLSFFDESFGEVAVRFIHTDCTNIHVAAKIPAGIGVKYHNTSKTETAVIVSLPDTSWKPDDDDTVKFDSWNEYMAWFAEWKQQS